LTRFFVQGVLLMGVMVTLSVIALLATLRKSSARPRAPADRPNFIMLFVDDLGYGDTGFTGHPTTKTPNIDSLAWGGKVLTTWYSGCAVCSGSRAALMTGRQFTRTGVPGVFGSTVNVGLPLNETTLAEQLKTKGYATGIVGKWHLGQRQVYLPGSRGFDYYLGIPYSDDMGNGRASSCPHSTSTKSEDNHASRVHSDWMLEAYEVMGYVHPADTFDGDPAAQHLPLIYQEFNRTRVVEQPLDFTHLAEKYNDFALEFIKEHKDQPFFFYMPFSHVHTTTGTQPEKQYAGCAWKNSTRRGAFGDALAEVDWIVGNVVQSLKEHAIDENTLILFTGDNGPWMMQGLSGGSHGLLSGRYAGYWNTGKGSTWEGGIREAAFAHWKGTIKPFTRTSEVVSSLDVMPTLSTLAGVPLPSDRIYDGRDMSEVLLKEDGRSKHGFLFFYGGCSSNHSKPSSVRHGKYKAHWCTGPGLGGPGVHKEYSVYPLLFDVDKDPSEAEPISTGEMPAGSEDAAAMHRIMNAYTTEVATFVLGHLLPAPDGPGEGPGRYGVCCNRAKACDCSKDAQQSGLGILGIGTSAHHDLYHQVSGRDPPLPPTREQIAI